MESYSIQLKHGLLPYLEGGDGPNLIFLHGAIATPLAYIKLLEMLSCHYHVYAPTHPGHGGAFKLPPRWKLVDFVNTHQEFLTNLGITKCIFVGHSFGGLLSLLLGPHHPSAQIVSIAPPGLPLNLNPADYVRFMTREIEYLYQRRPDLETMQEVLPAAGTIFYTVLHHPEDPSWFSENISRFDIRMNCKDMKNPITLIWGEEDELVPISIGYKLMKLWPQARLEVVSKKGHTFPVVDSEIAYQLIIKSIKENKG